MGDADNEVLYYAVDDVVARPITIAEWDKLCNMFACDGWDVWMGLKCEDLVTAISAMGEMDAEGVRPRRVQGADAGRDGGSPPA